MGHVGRGVLTSVLLSGCGWLGGHDGDASVALPSAARPGPAPAACEGERGTPGCFVQVPAGQGQAASWLQAHEVRAGDYAACLDAGGCLPDDVLLDGAFATVRVLGKEALPAVGVSWTGAVRYCAWLGGHLPDEALWVRAASNGDGRHWPWGDYPLCAPPSADDREAVLREVPAVMRLCDQVLDASAPPPEGPPVTDALRDACAHLRERSPAAGVHALRTWLGQPPLASAGCAVDGLVPVDTFDTVEHPLGLWWLAGNAAEWTASPWASGEATRVYRGGSWMGVEVSEFALDHREAAPMDVKLSDVGLRCAADAVSR